MSEQTEHRSAESAGRGEWGARGSQSRRHGSEPSRAVRHAIRDVPRLTLSKRLRRPPPKHDPSREHQFRYRVKKHGSLPQVVKFSGGRSSGMLLFALLENGLLDASRGDVIVFNNTSAEHPDTYRFVRDCMRTARRYEIPFFQVEFQTGSARRLRPAIAAHAISLGVALVTNNEKDFDGNPEVVVENWTLPSVP